MRNFGHSKWVGAEIWGHSILSPGVSNTITPLELNDLELNHYIITIAALSSVECYPARPASVKSSDMGHLHFRLAIMQLRAPLGDYF
jgi:hypothetical protein